MTRALSTILAGWLMVTYYGGTIAWYETEADCKVAGNYVNLGIWRCVPDRHAVDRCATGALMSSKCQLQFA